MVMFYLSLVQEVVASLRKSGDSHSKWKEEQKYCLWEPGFLGGDTNVLKSIVVMVPQFCEYTKNLYTSVGELYNR